MVRVVLDANVIGSDAFGGIPLKATIEAFRCEVMISPLIKRELLALPQALKNKLTPDQSLHLQKWLKVLIYRATLCRRGKRLRVCRDPKDDAYLSLCLESQADYLVTGDQDLLTVSRKSLVLNQLSHLEILTPKDFLARRGIIA